MQNRVGGSGLPQVMDEISGGPGSTTVQRTYAYGLQRIDENQFVSGAWTPSFYVYDGGGSVRQLTNYAQTVTDTYDYDAFGNVVNKTGATPNNFLYRGEQYDADLSLYYLRARYYNPATDRLLSRDPEPGNIAIPATLHKYLYTAGDPVNWVDPAGRAPRAGVMGGGPLADYALLGAFTLTVAYEGVVLHPAYPMHVNSGSLQALGININCSIAGDGSNLGADLSWATAGGGGTIFMVGDCAWDFSGKAPAPGAPATDAHTGGQTGSPTGPEDPDGCGGGGGGEGPGNPLFGPGPFAGDPIPARSPDQIFNDAERAWGDTEGYTRGCHSCGIDDPGTVSGHFVLDHQPVSALNWSNLPQSLYPQCLECSQEQGLAAARLLKKLKGPC